MAKSFSLLSAVIVAFLLFGLGGCRPAPPIAPATGIANEKPWREMKSKMDTMTPEQRAQYIREHPDEFASLGKIETPSPAAPPTSTQQ